MADLHVTQTAIEQSIKRLEKVTGYLDNAGNEKAKAIAAYDLAIAIATAKLALGTVKQVGGVALDGRPPATLIAKYAPGLCHEERANIEIASNGYKSVSTKITVLLAILSAQQSIFRHLQ